MAPSLIFRINRTTHLTPVILSGAPERFVSYRDLWRAVEGPRECVIYNDVSGSSKENATAAPRWLGGHFLRDRSWRLPLGAFHSSHGKTKPKAVSGTGHGKNSLRQHR